MGFAKLQTFPLAAKTSQSTAALTIASAINITAGDLIPLWLTHYGSGFTASVTDGLGNSYSQAGSYAFTGSQWGCSLFYTVATTGGACTIEITPGVSAYITAVAAEYSGQASSPLDHTNNNTGSAAANFTAGSLTVSGAGELCIACFVSQSNPLGVPVNGAASMGLVGVESVSNAISMIALDGIAGATFTPTANLVGASQSFAGVCASFKPASSGGGSGGGVSLSRTFC